MRNGSTIPTETARQTTRDILKVTALPTSLLNA